MRARNLKPGFFKNEDLAACGPWGMLLFEGLWLLADRSGRLEDRPSRIRVEIFPYAPRTNVVALLSALESKKFIVRYEVNCIKYIQVEGFCKHQNPHVNEALSTIPAPCSVSPKAVPSTVPLGLTPDSLIPSSLTPDSPLTPHAPDGAFDLAAPTDAQPKRKPAKKSGKRTTEEIKAALGDRLVWWEEFWKVYPCHDGMNPAIDVYERKVKTREMAAGIWKGASRYAARVAMERRTKPDSTIKFAQGWLNDERWLDDVAPAPKLVETPRKYFDPRSITG